MRTKFRHWLRTYLLHTDYFNFPDVWHVSVHTWINKPRCEIREYSSITSKLYRSILWISIIIIRVGICTLKSIRERYLRCSQITQQEKIVPSEVKNSSVGAMYTKYNVLWNFYSNIIYQAPNLVDTTHLCRYSPAKEFSNKAGVSKPFQQRHIHTSPTCSLWSLSPILDGPCCTELFEGATTDYPV